MALMARHATVPALPRIAFGTPRLTYLRGAIISTLVFLIALVDALLHPTTGFDLWAIKAVQGINFPGLSTFVDQVNTLTGSDGAVAMWAATLLLFLAIRWWLPALGLLTLPTGGVINYVIGEYMVSRTRPGLPELERATPWVNERSFPSGHVMGAIMFYGFLFVVARRIRHDGLRLAVQSFSAATIIAVGFSRVWYGAHWPTDVIGAYALGGLLLAGLLAVYARLDAAVGDLPLIRAANLPHDENRAHAHALASLVLFDGETVAKIYAPGLLPRAIYWLAFQAPFPYVANRAALTAAIHRRNLAGLLSEYWYGETRVARALEVDQIDGRLALRSEFVAGHEPADRAAAKAFLTDLRNRFDDAGLPTWQIDPRQPRAIDNVLETADGTYRIVDLESGLVSPLASLRTWGRALRRGLVPFYDEVFFDVTRAYVAREEPTMRAALGDARFADLVGTLDAAEQEAARWQAQEPRLWGRLLRGLMTGFGVKTWKRRIQARVAGSHEWGLAWMDRAVATWETEGRISTEEAVTLGEQIAAPTFQLMVPYLGAHFLISIPLRFPLGSIVRPLMVLGALAVATTRLLRRQIDRDAWKLAWSIHSPLVVVLSAVPGFGSFAYLAAKPVRGNRLLLRAVGDSALGKTPWNLYERSGLRRIIARPLPSEEIEAKGTAPASEDANDEGPAWELGWAMPRAKQTHPAAVPAPTATTFGPRKVAARAA